MFYGEGRLRGRGKGQYRCRTRVGLGGSWHCQAQWPPLVLWKELWTSDHVLILLLEIFSFVTIATSLSPHCLWFLHYRKDTVEYPVPSFLSARVWAIVLVDDIQVPALRAEGVILGAWPRDRNLGRISVPGRKSITNIDTQKGFCGWFLDLMRTGRLDRTKVFWVFSEMGRS